MKNFQEIKGNLSDIQIVVIRLRKEELGIDISHVREITKCMELTTVHEPTGYVQGVSNLRGQIITIVDIAKQLGFPTHLEISRTARIVIVEHSERILGLIVDEVREILKVHVGKAEIPLGNGETMIPADYHSGIGKIADRSIVLLNIERIFSNL